MAEVQILTELNENYKKVERPLMESEKDLQNVEEYLITTNKELKELSKDYEESQRRLRFWKTSSIVAIPLSIIGGILIGVNIK